jgi:hypothetical protein
MRKVLKQLQQMPPKFNKTADKDKLLWRQHGLRKNYYGF